MNIAETEVKQLSKQALNVYSKQHEVISENVANANKADYNRKNTDFSGMLNGKMKGRLKATHCKHFTESTHTPKLDDKRDETVDLSQEMGYLAKNQIEFDFTARALRRMYKKITMSITGRSNG
jgi:flagellar basal-body rod protein FlgB